MKGLLLAVILSFAPTPVDASCAQVVLGPSVLTRRDTHLPSDGGVLVGYGMAQDGEYDSDASWTANVAIARTELAPGLSVIRPTKGTAFKLATKSGKDRGSFTRDGKTTATAMTAPSPKKLVSKTSAGFRSTSTSVTLTLSAAPPADAVAIIAYDDKAKPLLYALLPDTHDKLLELEIDHSGGHCGTPTPPGKATLAGKVAFAYVDTFGRLSPVSTAISL